MAFNYFTFNGQNLKDFGFIIKKTPDYPVAEKDATSEEIQGKDGNEIVFNNRYKNRVVTYNIISLPTRVNCSNRELVNRLNYWLNTQKGYCKFTDTLNEGLYTEAYCQKIANVKDQMNGVVEAEITFELQPFWYISNNIEVINATNDKEYILNNPTGLPSYPRITIKAAMYHHGLSLTINNKTRIIPSGFGGTPEVVYDSESGDITVDGASINNRITNFDYPPHFNIGENKLRINHINAGDTIPYVLIEPRWRVL